MSRLLLPVLHTHGAPRDPIIAGGSNPDLSDREAFAGSTNLMHVSCADSGNYWSMR
jgi:hypothetical protein